MIILAAGGILLANRMAKVRWARDEGLKEVKRLAIADYYLESFNLAKNVEKYIPKDTTATRLLSLILPGQIFT